MLLFHICSVAGADAIAVGHCPFYLRGRCKRENCEFKHDSEKLKAAKAEWATKGEQAAKENDMAREHSLVHSATPTKNNAPSVQSGGFL